MRWKCKVPASLLGLRKQVAEVQAWDKLFKAIPCNSVSMEIHESVAVSLARGGGTM